MYTKGVQGLLAFLILAGVAGVVYWMVRAWARAGTVVPSEPDRPHALFDGGERYATADEQARIELDGPSAAGEGVLMAIVDALRARGVGTNPIEPESYGYMTVVEIDDEDVILRIGSGGDRDWMLFVEAPSGAVPPQIEDALRSLENVRNVEWITARR